MAENFNILIIGSTFGHKFFQYQDNKIEIEMKHLNKDLLLKKKQYNKKNINKIKRADHSVLQNILKLSKDHNNIDKDHNNIHVYFLDYTGTNKTYTIVIPDHGDVTNYTILEGTINNSYNTNNNKKKIITCYNKKQLFENFSSQEEYKNTFHCILIDQCVMKFFIDLNKFNILDAIIPLLKTNGKAYMRDIYIQKTKKITNEEISIIEDKISRLENEENQKNIKSIELKIYELGGVLIQIPIWKDISKRELQILSFIYYKKKFEEEEEVKLFVNNNLTNNEPKEGKYSVSSDLDSEPYEVAQKSELTLLMNEVFDEPDTNEYTMLLIAEMLKDGVININPQTEMINDILNLRVISQLNLQDIEDGLNDFKNKNKNTISILKKLLHYKKKYEGDEGEEGYEDPDSEEEEEVEVEEVEVEEDIKKKKKLEEDINKKNQKLEEGNKNKKISELKDIIEKIFNYIIYYNNRYYEITKINEFWEYKIFSETFVPHLYIINHYNNNKLTINYNFLDKYKNIIDYEIYEDYYPLYFHPYKEEEKENIIKLTKKNIQQGGLREQTTKALFSNNNELVWDFMKGKEKKRAIFSRLNGSEPDYEPSKWNNNQKIKETHNCYAYALDIIKHHFRKKPQPGYASGYSYLTDEDIRSCDRMFDRIKADNSSVIRVSYRDKCPKGYKKAYLAVDDGEDTDYHFYRMDSSGFWSHKPGSTNAREDNSDGSKIIQPHKAKRISTSHNYKKSCGYFCYDPKKINISNKPSNK